MKTQHTPGPWYVATVDCGAADDEITAEVDGCCINIAAVFGACEYSEARPNGENEPCYAVGDDEAKANAALIAAAPDMLAALKWAITFAEGSQSGDPALQNPVFNMRVEQCRAAIAKATGGKP